MRCLLITTSPTQPPVTGDRQRTALLLRAMRSVAEVDVLLIPPLPVPDECLAAEGAAHFTHVLRRWPEHRGPWRVLQLWGGHWARRIAHNLLPLSVDQSPDPLVEAELARMVEQRRYDVIVCRYLESALWSGAGCYAPSVLDIDGIMWQKYHSRREADNGSALGRLLLRWHEGAYRRLEPRAWRKHAHVWIANEQDVDLVDHPGCSVLPNIAFGVDEKPQPSPPPDSRTLLIVGTMLHPPNVQGVVHFLERVWPGVRQRVPGATVRLVGAGMSEDQKQRWSAQAGVDAVGFVPDLAQAYADCAAAVAPMYHGGGTKIKVLEALAHGRPIVASPHALRGYERLLPHGQGVWVAGDDQTMIEGCTQMLTDATLRRQFADAGLAAVREHFSFAAFEKQVADVLKQLAELGPVRARV